MICAVCLSEIRLLFDGLEQAIHSVRILAAIIETLQIDRGRMKRALEPALYATELADYLVRKGMPFRQAHHTVGKIVAEADRECLRLDKVSLLEMQKHSILL